MKHISTDGKITIVEGVVSRPALRAKLLSSEDQRVVHAKTEKKSLILLDLVVLCLCKFVFIEFIEGTTEVRFQILRSFISDLKRIL